MLQKDEDHRTDRPSVEQLGSILDRWYIQFERKVSMRASRAKGWIKCQKCNEIYDMGREHECRF
jgi:hypothetical protein